MSPVIALLEIQILELQPRPTKIKDYWGHRNLYEQALQVTLTFPKLINLDLNYLPQFQSDNNYYKLFICL